MTFQSEAFQGITLTLQLACVTTLLLLAIATPLAWWLAQSGSRWRALIRALVILPLILPPTVLGFYLLILMGQAGPIGQWMQALGLEALSFTFSGLVVGSVVFSLPFAVMPLQHAFESIGKRSLEVAATLRASPLNAFFTVALPLAWPGFVTALILSFAHTVGEFGVVLMVGGNIPGKTQVLSTQIYGYVEAMEYTKAHILAAIMLVFSFCVLLGLSCIKRQKEKVIL